MSAIFEMTLDSETLKQEEIEEICGCKRTSDQLAWLAKNGWIFHKNKGGDPVIGRMYARMKMAGISPKDMTVPGDWMPDLSQVR